MDKRKERRRKYVAPDQDAPARDWITYRARMELQDIMKWNGITNLEMANLLEMDFQQFKNMLYHKSINMSIEVVARLSELHPKQYPKPIRKIRENLRVFDGYYVLTGRRLTAYEELLRAKVNEVHPDGLNQGERSR